MAMFRLLENCSIKKQTSTRRLAFRTGLRYSMYACTFGKEDVVDVLLNTDADPDVCDKDNSLLIIASKKGHVQIC